MNELQREIVEKNQILDSLNRERKPKREKIQQVKIELDRLLYQYYKSLTCTCSSVLTFWMP
jgi:hypothetical protein